MLAPPLTASVSSCQMGIVKTAILSAFICVHLPNNPKKYYHDTHQDVENVWPREVKPVARGHTKSKMVEIRVQAVSL